MSDTPSRGSTSFRPRARGGRNRGKSARARGSTRGMRIPPEYLAQVIAQREGRNPNEIEDPTEEDLDEEEVKAYYARFANRPLESNAGKYEEPLDEGINSEEGMYNNDSNYYWIDCMVDDDTNDILARHRIRESENVIVAEKPLKKLEGDVDDVDHALAASLRQISLRSGKRPNRNEAGNESKVITIEWNEELEEMKRDKADAEARAGESTYEEGDLC
jgi:hypothetical protein